MTGKRAVPKVSGLVRTGAVVPATQEQTAGLPEFHHHETPPEATVHNPTQTLLQRSVSTPPSSPTQEVVVNEGARATGKTITVPLSKLKPSPYNSRKVRSTKRLEEMAEMLRESGQLLPLNVYPGTGEDAGLYLILGGVTRWQAAPMAGFSELEISIESVDPADHLELIKLARLYNDSIDETDLDRALAAKQLETDGYSQNEIANALGFKSRSNINRFKAFFELPQDIVELGKTEPAIFSATVAEIILSAYKTHGEQFAIDLLKKAIGPDRWGQDTLKKHISTQSKKVERENAQRTRAKRLTTIDITHEGASIGWMTVNKAAQAGRRCVKLEATTSEALADKLADRIAAVIREFNELDANA